MLLVGRPLADQALQVPYRSLGSGSPPWRCAGSAPVTSLCMGVPVIASYGMGSDSTALLLRWLTEPASRDFALSDLVVVTAQLGSEFDRTYRLVETHVLPLLRAHQVRYVQVARAGPRESDGIVVLSDTRAPVELVRRGPWRLIDELIEAGTVPQVAHGRRLCTVKHKGWALDRVIEQLVGDQAFRHVIGFNADETRRAATDSSYSSPSRTSEYPLIEWGWGREYLEDWIEGAVGERWMKSRCSYCPFSAVAGNRQAHLADWAAEPERGAEALFVEHVSLALNPRMALYGTTKAVDLAAEAGLDEVLGLFRSRVAASEHALYRVRRIWTVGRDRTTGERSAEKKGVGWRSIEVLGTGSRAEMQSVLRRRAASSGLAVVDDRAVVRAPGTTYPTAEEMLVVAPAGVAAKERPGFGGLWSKVVEQATLFAA